MVDCAANFSLAGDNQTISGTAKDIAEHNENLFCGLRKHYLCVIELAKCRMKLLVSLGDRFIFLFGGDVKSHCLLKVCIPGTWPRGTYHLAWWLSDVRALKMVIFHRYVSLPEATLPETIMKKHQFGRIFLLFSKPLLVLWHWIFFGLSLPEAKPASWNPSKWNYWKLTIRRPLFWGLHILAREMSVLGWN